MQDQHGSPDRIRLVDRPIPEVARRQVRIRVAFAGLNPIDWQIVESAEVAASFGVGVPMGFGNDFSGTIDAVGDAVTRWRVGDRVFGGARAAAAADHVVLDEDDHRLHPTPGDIDDQTAGVIDVVGRTASAIADALQLTETDTVLISAAGGGVGTILTQLAVSTGARAIGTGSTSTAPFIAGLGAVPLTYGPDLADRLRDLVPDGITAAADLYDTATAHVALALGVPAHRVVTIEADQPPEGTRPVNGADAKPDALPRLLRQVSAGQLRIPIQQTYPLENYLHAIEQQRQRHTRGKLTIDLRL